MKITVLGSGAMGSLFGGCLAESGHQVTLIDVNDAHLEAIRREGLRLQTDAGDRHVQELVATRPEQASGSPDLLVVFTKTLHTSSAMRGIRHLISAKTHVLSLQNGLGNVEKLSESVAIDRILIGVTTWPADMVAPGQVHSHGQGAIRLMTADGVDRPALQDCVSALNSASLNCFADTHVWAAIWEKVAFNAALNSICAVTQCTVDQLALLPQGQDLALEVVDEVISVARACGVNADREKPRANVLHAIGNHVGHKPSMLQDVLAGRKTEIGAINGAVVDAALKLQIPTPKTQALATLVQLIDARAHGHQK